MSVRYLSQQDIQKKIDFLGDTFSSGEESFSLFEKKYLEVYDVVFSLMSEVVKVKESGRLGEAEACMSKWVEPSRIYGVVIMKKSALKPQLLEAAHRALRMIEGDFAIMVDDFPTVIYVFPGGEVLVADGSLGKDLKLIGL